MQSPLSFLLVLLFSSPFQQQPVLHLLLHLPPVQHSNQPEYLQPANQPTPAAYLLPATPFACETATTAAAARDLKQQTEIESSIRGVTFSLAPPSTPLASPLPLLHHHHHHHLHHHHQQQIQAAPEQPEGSEASACPEKWIVVAQLPPSPLVQPTHRGAATAAQLPRQLLLQIPLQRGVRCGR